MASQKPTCNHAYLQQARYGALPPLYFSTISSYPSTNTTKPTAPDILRKSTYAHLLLALHDLGPERARSAFLAHELTLLRKELEYGMSEERKERMMFYLLGIENQRVRAATELYLAKFPGFMFDERGRLDCRLHQEVEEDQGEGWEGWNCWNCWEFCGVM
jgi:hypothetical protein